MHLSLKNYRLLLTTYFNMISVNAHIYIYTLHYFKAKSNLYVSLNKSSTATELTVQFLLLSPPHLCFTQKYTHPHNLRVPGFSLSYGTLQSWRWKLHVLLICIQVRRSQTYVKTWSNYNLTAASAKTIPNEILRQILIIVIFIRLSNVILTQGTIRELKFWSLKLYKYNNYLLKIKHRQRIMT